MKQLCIRPAKPEDCEIIGRLMRPDDRREIAALGFADPVDCLEKSLRFGAETFTGCHGDMPMGMFGVHPDGVMSSRACVWMLGSDSLNGYAREMVTVTRRYFAAKLNEYEYLYNWVDSRYEKAKKWLRVCGAEFLPERDREFSGVRFCYFEIRRKE